MLHNVLDLVLQVCQPRRNILKKFHDGDGLRGAAIIATLVKRAPHLLDTALLASAEAATDETSGPVSLTLATMCYKISKSINTAGIQQSTHHVQKRLYLQPKEQALSSNA